MSICNSYVAVLDVGHGNSTVLFDRSNACIIDCGPGSSLLEFLTSEDIIHIDNIFLSHADQDHIEGLVALLSSDKVTIDKVYVNSDGTKKSAIWDDLVYILSHNSVKGGTKFTTAITRSDGKFMCGDMIIETISPTPYLAAKSPGSADRNGRRITSNSISASFRVIWKDNPVAYFAGDIDRITLDDIKDHDISISSPILVFPHHGGHISSGDILKFTNDLCEMTDCKTVIFSIGRNKHNNPLPEVVKAIRDKVKNVRIACTQLSKNCAVNLKNTPPLHLSSVFAKGRATNECCGGTFIIALSETVNCLPDFHAHQSFIDAETSSPICK